MFRNDKPSVRNDSFYRFCCFSFFRDFYPILFAPFMIRSEFIESLMKSLAHSLSVYSYAVPASRANIFCFPNHLIRFAE